MTICRECCSVEQGYKEIKNEDGDVVKVCACCASEEIGEVNEDQGSDR